MPATDTMLLVWYCTIQDVPFSARQRYVQAKPGGITSEAAGHDAADGRAGRPTGTFTRRSMADQTFRPVTQRRGHHGRDLSAFRSNTRNSWLEDQAIGGR